MPELLCVTLEFFPSRNDITRGFHDTLEIIVRIDPAVDGKEFFKIFRDVLNPVDIPHDISAVQAPPDFFHGESLGGVTDFLGQGSVDEQQIILFRRHDADDDGPFIISKNGSQ